MLRAPPKHVIELNATRNAVLDASPEYKQLYLWTLYLSASDSFVALPNAHAEFVTECVETDPTLTPFLRIVITDRAFIHKFVITENNFDVLAVMCPTEDLSPCGSVGEFGMRLFSMTKHQWIRGVVDNVEQLHQFVAEASKFARQPHPPPVERVLASATPSPRSPSSPCLGPQLTQYYVSSDDCGVVSATPLHSSP